MVKAGEMIRSSLVSGWVLAKSVRASWRCPLFRHAFLSLLVLSGAAFSACRPDERGPEPAAASASAAEPSPNEPPPVKERFRDKLKRLFRASADKLRTLGTFDTAKRAAAKIYEGHRATFYCNCDYSEKGTIDGERCGYKPRIPNLRAKRLEWEHVVPAHAFGGTRTCWATKMCLDKKGKRYGGRECCEKQDADFRAMEADLQNLVPEIGELNQDRSNFRYGDVEGEERRFGSCDFEVDRRAEVVEIDPSLRGDVARIYLYMYHAYPGRLELRPEDIDRFEKWHEEDPPNPWEIERNERIRRLQGAGNPLIAEDPAPAPPAPAPPAAEAPSTAPAPVGSGSSP